MDQTEKILQAVEAVAARCLNLVKTDVELRSNLCSLVDAVLGSSRPTIADSSATIDFLCAGAAPPCSPQSYSPQSYSPQSYSPQSYPPQSYSLPCDEQTAETIRASRDAAARAPASMQAAAEDAPASASCSRIPEPSAAASVGKRRWIPLDMLTNGQGMLGVAPLEPVLQEEFRPAPATDMNRVAAHFRLKAEGVRWTRDRRRRIAAGADFHAEIGPFDREIIARAKEIDCYLWTNDPRWDPPGDSELLETLAACFETAADALEFALALSEAREQPDLLASGLELLAQAQSALRVAVSHVHERPDADQGEVYGWLKCVTADKHVYICRHMRADDPADPAACESLRERVRETVEQYSACQGKEKERRRLFNKMTYELKRIGEGKGAPEAHWKTVARTVDELVEGGLPASNKELRDVLLPFADDVPHLDELLPGFDEVLGAIERYRQERVAAGEIQALPVRRPEVREVARLLNGRTVLLVGGERRGPAQEAICKAFRLSELIWMQTRAHQPLDQIEQCVRRSDVALVLLAIRWSSHSFGELAKTCELAGKPLVRLPSGYNPNQVAVQIIEQCGDRLRNVPEYTL